MKATIKYPLHVADRLITLKKFKKVMHEAGRSKASRSSAYRNYKQVLKQVNDSKLMELRRRLLVAVKLGDQYVEWKLGNQIKAYLSEPLFVNPNWQK